MATSSTYYNEHDPFAAAWLRELMADGLIPAGDVDERSIEDVTPNEIATYTSCHFFAGIGGWPLALRLAGWPDDRPVWTGSAPCQPFSAAGKGGGFADERHLWPSFLWLISQQRPAVVFGEQVASKAGRDWFDVVSSDLEAHGYAVGAADLCAAGVGAPHIRQRLYFVADATSCRYAQSKQQSGSDRKTNINEQSNGGRKYNNAIPLANPSGARLEERRRQPGDARPEQPTAKRASVGGFWSDAIWLPCTDGKARATKPGLFPLAHGFPNRVGILRGAGNAIVPPLAAEFVGAYLEARK